ncbi:zinc metallopeptidase RseP [Aliidiomarina taiwanensis]|uniref:Zinc metalloprotease n=1 Tax=Aliidiomarina taiwanensis TaxID=946228 RepID=A0A432XAC3_9GAMM|nr:sigma E protease regulator RseP [Aliidiomarina taiwanensis]RUO44353.1 zinc metallopeptidase RseP [Aliidiomarina taiwanensis]
MESFIWSVGAFIVALGLVVTFHEFGHFWVARRCGVKVLTFSIGFGKPLFKWHGKDGTQYQVATIPLGGYVRMLDHEVDPTDDSTIHQSFRAKPVWQRIAVVAAGPIANFIFSIFALMLMLMIGMPSVRPVIGAIDANSLAAEAGLKAGSEVVALDGRQVQDWQDVNLKLVARIGDASTLMRVRTEQGIETEHVIDLTEWNFDPDTDSTLASLGIQVYQPEVLTTVAWVAENSPAEAAQLQVNDKIIGFNGTHTQDWEQIRSFIAEHPNENMRLMVERDSQVITLPVIIGELNNQGYLGVAPHIAPYPEEYRFHLQYGPVGALIGGVERTWELMGLSLSMVKKLIVGDVAVKNLSGPIGIAQGAGTHASYGLVYFLSFMALISVSLGVLNLLPIPMLDGGHLLFYIVEWVRGKPVPERIQEIGFRIGLMLLLLLMIVAVFNDINRLLP